VEIKLLEDLARNIGQRELKEFGIDFDHFKYNNNNTKTVEINLSKYTPMKLLELKTLLTDRIAFRGAKTAISDIDTWLAAVKDTKSAKLKNVRQFYSVLIRHMRKVAGQRIYMKDDESNVWWPYYMERVIYHPKSWSGRGSDEIPAHTNVSLFYFEFGKRLSTSITFWDEDVKYQTVVKSLAEKNLIPETEELRASYLAEYRKYMDNVELIGKQFLAVGTATDDLDGNPKKSSDSWWYRRTNKVTLDRQGPSRVVIDLFREDDKEEEDRHRHENHLDKYFWSKQALIKPNDKGELDDDDETLDEELAETTDVEEIDPEVPTHCTTAVFDLQRHLRLKVHIAQLTEYVYDPNLGDKLVLPTEQRALIDILLAQKEGGFKDIIQGKGAGAVILSAGPPGTGKTLTAEAYAEVTARPLYTVQCSQLGTNPNHLEDNLLKTFARSDRWNAILLLDEADVYVAERGNNLVQNAIVGVFLRTLEYYKGTMFMMTNRADLVDDAIASRCIARIEYAVPSVEAQTRIWKILADNTRAEIAPKVIAAFARAHPELSGRDVKNLLKLAMLISDARGEPITEKLLNFVKVFKPTSDVAERDGLPMNEDRD
jgi:hypothetical protein